MPCSRCRSFSRRRICAWIVTSSAVVGSSAIRKSGSDASVMAIMTRCFWPPERRNGYSSMRCSGSGMPTRASHSIALARAAVPRKAVCASIASTIWVPTRMTGLRLVPGSWKIMPMRPPRTARIDDSGSVRRSPPSRTMRPPTMRPFSGRRRISASAVMLLPQPDSPTRAKVSPRRIDSCMPSIALTTPASASSATSRPSMSRVAGRCAAVISSSPRGAGAGGSSGRAGRRHRARRRRKGWPPAPGSP